MKLSTYEMLGIAGVEHDGEGAATSIDLKSARDDLLALEVPAQLPAQLQIGVRLHVHAGDDQAGARRR